MVIMHYILSGVVFLLILLRPFWHKRASER